MRRVAGDSSASSARARRVRTHAAIVSLSLATLAACGGRSSRLEGHWRGAFVEGVPPEAQAAAMTFAKAMELEVRGDVLTVTTPDGKQTGSFVVDSDDKLAMVIHTDPGSPDDKQTFTFAGEKTVKWRVAEGKTALITFVRE